MLFATSLASVIIVFFIFIFLLGEAWPAFEEVGAGELVLGENWDPEGDPDNPRYPRDPSFGANAIIWGTILVTLGAMVIAIPLGIGSAIFIAEMAPYRLKIVLKTAIELLSGIPSVVFGFFGLLVLVNWIRITWDLTLGFTWLAGSILLGIMALPTIVSVSEDAISTVPRDYKEASLALGATRWQTTREVVLPAAMSGITAAVILGMGRAIGETMAVMMVTGNRAVVPDPIVNVTSPVRTITGTLAIEFGEVPVDSMHYYVLFALAVILLVLVLFINLSATFILSRIEERFHPRTKKAMGGILAPARAFARNWKELAATLAAILLSTLFVSYMAGPVVGVSVIAASLVAHFLLERMLPRHRRQQYDRMLVLALLPVAIAGIATRAIDLPAGAGMVLLLAIVVITVQMVPERASRGNGLLVVIVLWLFYHWFGASLGAGLVAAGLLASQSLSLLTPKSMQRVAYGIVTASLIAVLAMVGVIIYYIVANGYPALSWEFLTESPRNNGREGGIYPAILGTLYLVAGAILVAIPLGVGAGIYLSEYAHQGKLTQTIRTGIDNLNGTPSIVFGLFGYAFFVAYLGFGISLLAGALTLSFMILPTVIRTTEEAVRAVPQGFREGSLALGASKWQTIRKVVLPPAASGVITGVVLSIGRAAGETAPILFTAVVFIQRFLPNSVHDPVMALPYHLFYLATSIPESERQQAGTALVLLIMILIIYSVATALRMHFHKKMKW
ncbi:MAG: phosphate ABC transporter permease PstA [Thermoplasmata archaeon]|nr:phosphate ABC transporter permease PstA [Thermoplasmata archaeon]